MTDDHSGALYGDIDAGHDRRHPRVLNDLLFQTDANGAMSDYAVGYMKSRTQNALHQAILSLFVASREAGMRLPDLERRLGMNSAQVANLLGSAGAWTLPLASRFALAMGHELTIGTKPLPRRPADTEVL